MTVGQLCVVGFDNSHHGSTTATLSCSATEANVAGLPAFPWPKAEYPQLKYPLAQNEPANTEEENRCVAVVQKIIEAKRAEGGAVGAIIVEPISSIGNQMATPNFYRKLRALAKDEGIPFIVDETKTGMGSSGKNWAHDYWYLQEDHAPDFTTFGGKTGISGFYSTIDHRLNDEATSYTQNINMVDLLRYGQIWNIIESSDLLHYQKDTRAFLKIELARIVKEKELFTDVRGYGTHLGFDCHSEAKADSVQRWLFRNGIQALKCGPKTFGLRPSLVLGVKDAAVLRNVFSVYHPNFERK